MFFSLITKVMLKRNADLLLARIEEDKNNCIPKCLQHASGLEAIYTRFLILLLFIIFFFLLNSCCYSFFFFAASCKQFNFKFFLPFFSFASSLYSSSVCLFVCVCVCPFVCLSTSFLIKYSEHGATKCRFYHGFVQ